MRLSEIQVQQFWAYHQLLRERNEELDLTRLHAFDTVVLKHYVDSALLATLVDLPSPLLDLGSGAGFPGIPLKIVRPDVDVLLAEPRGKRVAFLEEAIRALGLRGIEVVPHRISASFDRPVRGVVTRAVESIPATLARIAPWLAPGGRVLFMKGPAVAEEIGAAEREWGHAFRLLRDIPYTIAETPHARRLVLYERLEHGAPVTGTLVPRSGAPEAEAPEPPGDGAPGSGRELRDIESAQNATYKELCTLLGGRGVRKLGRAMLAGGRTVHEALRDFPDRCVAWITPGASSPPPREAPASLAWYRVAPALFRDLDVAGTGGPLVCVTVPAFERWDDAAPWPDGCTLFVPFQDPENVGAVLRTAAAFGVGRVVLLQEAAHPFHPRSARAAGSALLRLALERGPSLAEFSARGAPVFALSAAGRDAGAFTFPERFGLLVGLEGPGLPEAWRGAETLAVPMAPGTDSLNAATATAIVLYLWSRQHP